MVDARYAWQLGDVEFEDEVEKHLPEQHDQKAHGVLLYHGTTVAAAEKIKKEGILLSKSKELTIWAAGTFETAKLYGNIRSERQGSKRYAVVTILPTEEGFAHYGVQTFGRNIRPEEIDHIDIFEFVKAWSPLDRSKDLEVGLLKSAGTTKFFVPLVISDDGEDYEVVPIVEEKHLPEQHDQQKHAGKDWASRSGQYDVLRDSASIIRRQIAAGRKVFRSDVEYDWELLGLKRPTDEELIDAYIPKTPELNCTLTVVVNHLHQTISVVVYNGAAQASNKMVSRGFDTKNGMPYVIHHKFDLPMSLQKQGLGMDVLERSEALYERIGVRSIELYADSEVGTYAWARAGFDFANPDEKLRIEMAFVEYLDIKGLPKQTRDGILKKIPQHAWEYAAWKYDDSVTGKEFLLSYAAAWEGVKFLNPKSEGYQIGKAYYAWRRIKFAH